jgi:hypothetical protein
VASLRAAQALEDGGLVGQMSAAAEEIARDDQSGQTLAEKWNLEYLKASAVSVDPRALSLIEREDCKQHRAIPLAIGSDGALVAICSPSEERFASIREVTGEQTRFVLVSEGTLDALLGSRMFSDVRGGHQATDVPKQPETTAEEEVEIPEAEEVEEATVDPGAGPAAAARRKRGEDDASENPGPSEEPVAPAEKKAVAPSTVASAPASDPSVENIVSAVLNALKHRVGSSPELAPTVPAREAVPPEPAPLPGSTEELLSNLDATVETWSALRAALARVHAEFEDTKKSLRDAKEQLSVAHADNDQYRKRVRTLEGELAESRELVTQARARLQEAAGLLEADPTQLTESAELL